MGQNSKKQKNNQIRKLREQQALQEKEKNKKLTIIVAAATAAILAIIILIIVLACQPVYVSMTVSYVDDAGQTHTGDIVLKLNPVAAPITVKNFKNLVEQGFYDGLTFHRVIEGFMIQGGDPLGDGTGGSENTIKGEFASNGVKNSISHVRGVISMARGSYSMDSASSQFFIVHKDSTKLDGDYAAFGHVISGMEHVDGIANMSTNANDKPLQDAIIVSAKLIKKP